ncbi:myb-like protein X isoform X2 [Mytilus californianus]|uniref:myb-like protein X isoform X2 n=1 Tax=Mytilus californianus TaxID=6549 RepID=UPI00224595E6|nr:myb-like protein X isoform X2 [Mytilus californianus]
MRLKPLQLRTEDEQFSRYIRTEYNKEMAMANSSYARAAGIQSEISKVTVTRVASSEVECKRQTNVYRKDMIISINNITREQRMLRKSMVRYSKKKKQHKLVKEKREKEILEKEEREREHIAQWEQIHALLNLENGVSMEHSIENTLKHKHENENSILNDENNNETFEDKNKTKNKKSSTIDEKNEQSLNPFEILPAITEAENEHETNQENENEEVENKPLTSGTIPPSTSETIPSSSTSDTTQSSENYLSPLFSLTLRPLKPRKQIVSFSDIIKLKHSHNTNKLFDMVHVLATRSGVNESVEKRRAERRNSRIPKGSTDAVVSASLRKQASIIYPMKYGYGDHASNNQEKFDFYDNNVDTDNNVASLESELTDRSDKNSSLNGTSPSKKIRRKKSITGFSDEIKKLRKEELINNGIVEEGRRYTNLSTRSTSSKLLPSINSTKSSPNHSRNNSVSWTEAFGLLKIVHNID